MSAPGRASTCSTTLRRAASPSLHTPAARQPRAGPYVGAGAGINLFHDTTSRGFRINDDDIGSVGLGALGWGFGNGLRVEGAGNHRGSETDPTAGPGPRRPAR